MALRFPSSMDECVYFTRRATSKGKIIAWVFRQQCEKCKKGVMGKPLDEKTGRAKIRAQEYICQACNYTVGKDDYEATLTCSIQYVCDGCGASGETTAPFKRKVFEGVPAIVFTCGSCGKKQGVTKKMKESKKKGGMKEGADVDDDDF
ncbi:hypothetical protein HYS47_01140 [Candidatus Woesearchaeota archaeon]|nr:hypothetical protein [Candidatus Woesearchaeota archaeon]